MVIRATSINLNPYIDKVCMEDLTVSCDSVDTSAAGVVRETVVKCDVGGCVFCLGIQVFAGSFQASER